MHAAGQVCVPERRTVVVPKGKEDAGRGKAKCGRGREEAETSDKPLAFRPPKSPPPKDGTDQIPAQNLPERDRQVSAIPQDQPVLLPVPADPTISFRVWFKVGSQDDPPGKEGLAAITASMICRRGHTLNSYEQILDKLFPLAAGYPLPPARK